MKAQDILIEFNNPEMTINDKRQLIQRYGQQCAKEALENASDNLTQTVGQWNADFSNQRRSILNTEIITP